MVADAELLLTEIHQDETTLQVRISIKNPSNQAVISVQSWLKYDQNALKKAQKNALNVENSDFDFVAPGENEFDEQQGIVKIGRSSIKGEVRTNEIEVAIVTFEKLQQKDSKIEFYDYRSDHTGKTSIRILEDGFPVNILKEKPKEFEVSVESNVSEQKDSVTPTPIQKEESKKTVPDAIPLTLPPVKKEISPKEVKAPENTRPDGVRITTENSSVMVLWTPDPSVKGYNLYYGTKSGFYIQRKVLSNVSSYQLEGLSVGKRYYFAITSYDHTEKESAYSNEVSVVVGNPDSSSASVSLVSKQEIIDSIQKQTDSGPELWGLVFISIILSLFLLGKRARV